MMESIILRRAVAADSHACAEILAHYICNTAVNMHGEPLPPEYFSQLMGKPFFVAEDGEGVICGYAYSDVWNSRCGYCSTVEVSVYIRDGRTGMGVGGRLLQTLLDSLRESNMRAAVAVITLPNQASVALHEKLGFVRGGVLPSVGWKFNTAYDIGLWVKNFV